MDCVLAISEERKPVMQYLRVSSPSSFLLFCITASHFFIPFFVEATHDSLGFCHWRATICFLSKTQWHHCSSESAWKISWLVFKGSPLSTDLELQQRRRNEGGLRARKCSLIASNTGFPFPKVDRTQSMEVSERRFPNLDGLSPNFISLFSCLEVSARSLISHFRTSPVLGFIFPGFTCPGFPVLGFSVLKFPALRWPVLRIFAQGFSVQIFSAPGFSTPEFYVPGFTVTGFSAQGFSAAGFYILGFSVPLFSVSISGFSLCQEYRSQDSLSRDSLSQDSLPQDSLPHNFLSQENLSQDSLSLDFLPQYSLPGFCIPGFSVPGFSVPGFSVPVFS